MTVAPPTQRAIAALARDAVALGPGGRLPTNLEYQQSLGVGAGTVQQAVRILTTSDALEIAARGHQGRHVVRRDVGALWSLARFAPVRFVYPPPGPLELYGLMEAIGEHLAALRVPFTVAHRQGGLRRVDLITAGEADATVLSHAAAVRLGDGSGADLGWCDLGQDTYYAPGAIVVLRRTADPPPHEPLRVGIDRASFDHVRLTEAEFPPGPEHRYVECDFPGMPVAVLEGRVDVGIWHRALLLIPPQLAGLALDPLRRTEAVDARRELSGAVVLFGSPRPEVAVVCRDLDGVQVRERQEELLALDPSDPRLAERYWLR
jgi:hypothetical protein